MFLSESVNLKSDAKENMFPVPTASNEYYTNYKIAGRKSYFMFFP